MSAALVPVKRLSASKSRLWPDLDAEGRAELALAMVEDVVAALIATPEIDRVAVATPDDRVAAAVRRLGAEALHGPDPGLNQAIEAAAEKLHLAPDAPLLVMLGDVAGALPDEIGRLFETLASAPPGPCVVLSPSRDGGTSALLRRPHDAIPARFGPDSAARHREAAAAAGVRLLDCVQPSLELDLDAADDVAQFVATPSGGPRTRAVLHRLGWRSAAPGSPA